MATTEKLSARKIIERFFGINKIQETIAPLTAEQFAQMGLIKEPLESAKKTPARPIDLPSGRSSAPPKQTFDGINKYFDDKLGLIDTDYDRNIIPNIRKLCKVNPDMSQALQNVVTLGNTGHTIHFDPAVSDEQAKAMRDHITNKHKQWASGLAGADGMVNRMFSQIMIGGAVSNEWVPNVDLTSIEAWIPINVEDIYCKLNGRKTDYDYYQKVKYKGGYSEPGTKAFKKLNKNTYKYFALNGDGEVPYGFPPYMSVLGPICTQENMNESINYVISQLGLLGFLEVLVTAPDRTTDQSDDEYNTMVEGMLMSAKARVTEGFKDGVVVGLKDEHEFEFKSIARDFAKVIELYKQNELQVASALKQDATLWGRDYNSSESQISVIFMKMIAEFKNVHNIIATNLEFGYDLELRLAGYKFKSLKVRFNRATAQDELKYQQAREIHIRNLTSLLLVGTISQYQFGQELGYDEIHSDTPLVPWEIIAGGSVATPEQQQAKDKREKGKDASDKKVRDKNKPTGSKKSN